MASTTLTFAALLIALIFALALGWFLGGRPVTEWRARHAQRDAEARDLDEKFRRAIAELAGATERAKRADDLAMQLDEVREEQLGAIGRLHEQQAADVAALRDGQALETSRLRDAHAAEIARARIENAALAAQNAALQADADNSADRERLLIEAREALRQEFEAAGAKVLEGAQESFLKRAHDRFAQSEDQSEARIKALLAPVGERLKNYEEQVASLEAKRADSFSHLNGVINEMRAGQEAIRAALSAGWLRTWTEAVHEAPLPDLDKGESACIRIALAHQSGPGHDALLLMDERAGRAVAQENQLRVAGTAAVIGIAQTRGLIPSARNVFETLLQSDFRISAEVIRTVLARIDVPRD